MNEWQKKPLGEAAQFINGLWKGEDPPFVHVGVIRNTNFAKDGSLDDTDIAYLDVEEKKFQKRRLQPGDLILEKSGGGPKQPVGRVVLFDKLDGNFSFSNFTAAIRVNDKNILDPRFLHKYLYWFYLAGRTESMQSHSTGIRNLNGDAYKAISIAYPTLPEQRRIVEILDEAFEAIGVAKGNAEKRKRNAAELRTSQQVGALAAASADRSPEFLEDLVSIDCTLSYGIVQPGDDVPNGLPVVRPVDLVSDFVGVDGLKRVDPGVANSYQRTTLKGEDLLLCVRGTTGTVSIASPELVGSNVTRGIVPIRFPRDKLTARLGYFLLRSESVQRQIKAKTYGAALMQINIGDLRKITLTIPPSEQQAALLEKLEMIQEATEQLERVCDEKLVALDELKKSLLHHAFTGQLTAKKTDQLVGAVA